MNKKVALITGGSGGIGLETARVLGAAGYIVVVNSFDDSVFSAAESLKGMGIEAIPAKFDVTDENAVGEGVRKIGVQHGKIDVLINGAGGLGGRQRFEVMETAFFRKVMALNFDSVFFVSRACIPYLKNGSNPSIINFTSIAGYNAGGPGAGVYGASKAAVTTLTRGLAKDLSEYGIRVNAVSPGTIDTPFHAATPREIVDGWKEGILMKRLGRPEEVASVIEFLVSDKASYLTGEVIQINGGQAFM